MKCSNYSHLVAHIRVKQLHDKLTKEILKQMGKVMNLPWYHFGHISDKPNCNRDTSHLTERNYNYK